MVNKQIHIIGGGTINQGTINQMAQSFGTLATEIHYNCNILAQNLDCVLHLTKMAGGQETLETNQDVSDLVDKLVADHTTKIIFMTAAVSDEKIVNKLRSKRKDIFAVGFSVTNNATPQEQYIAGLNFLKASSLNLVLANDTATKLNMVITPEESRYHETTDRMEAVKGLVEMTLLRSHLTFTRSTVVDGKPIPWDNELIPNALKTVVDYCIGSGAYKPFRGATVGHFACKLDDNTFLTSIRKTNFNDLAKNGLVKIKTDGPDNVIAYGAKPSVGGQSQRIVFQHHSDGFH